MRQRAMVKNGNGTLRGWFDENEVPVRITPWKTRWGTRTPKRTVRPLKKLTPAIEALLKGTVPAKLDRAA